MQYRRTHPSGWTLAASFCSALSFSACAEPQNDDGEVGETADDDADDGSTSDADTTDGLDASTAPVTDGDTTAGDDDDTAPATDDGATESTGEAPSGDMWVDAEGTIIGLYRVTTDDDEEAVESLVDPTDATWFVSPDRTALAPIDVFGMVYWESSDCTGARYFVEPNETYGPFREGIVSRVWTDFFEVVFVVPPDTARVEIVAGSWWEGGYGCFAVEEGDEVPTEFFAESDMRLVTPPVFVAPLSIEHF